MGSLLDVGLSSVSRRPLIPPFLQVAGARRLVGLVSVRAYDCGVYDRIGFLQRDRPSARMVTLIMAVSAVEAMVVAAAGASSDSAVVSAVIAGCFLVVNSILTVFLTFYLNDRRRQGRKKGRAKTR